MRRFALALAAVCSTSLAFAQGYPNKPLRIVVPFAAGGAVDTIARVVGQKLAEELAQPVIVEDKPGANANIGAEAVAKAAPDGYTLLLGANGLATNVTLFPNLSFHALKDFAPVARIGYSPVVLVVASSSPYKSVNDLIAAGRAKAGSLTYASTGNGSSNHLAAELLKSVAHFDALHVPYKGGAPALTDLMAERTSFMLINPLEVLPHVRSGRLRALAVASPNRIPQLADVPTLSEAGVPGYDASVWWALVAPAKTPADIVARLNTEVNRALGDAAVRQKLNELGVVLTPGSPDALGRFLSAEVDKWAKVINAAGIKAD